MKWNRARWSGLAALALVGGLLTPVAMAPSANAATITVSDADCNNGRHQGAPISGSPGDVVDITGNFGGCTSLTVRQEIVDGSSAIGAATNGSTISLTAVGMAPNLYWQLSIDDTNFLFTSIVITLGSTNVISSGGISLANDGVTNTATDWNVTISGAAPNPPTPTPATPPSAPTSAEATAGDGEVTVSWQAPTSQGSFPVTNYQVQSTPSSQGCLVPVTATSCKIAGLRNGTEYTFQVRALNGGGWGSWATTPAVTPGPRPGPDASIIITGSRSANDRVARVRGETTGLAGATLQSMVRVSDRVEFTAGSTRQVGPQGGFTWQRRAKAGVTVEVYFTAGDISSNTVTIAGRR